MTHKQNTYHDCYDFSCSDDEGDNMLLKLFNQPIDVYLA